MLKPFRNTGAKPAAFPSKLPIAPLVLFNPASKLTKLAPIFLRPTIKLPKPLPEPLKALNTPFIPAFAFPSDLEKYEKILFVSFFALEKELPILLPAEENTPGKD